MCEFKVVLKRQGSEEKVAEDISRAEVEGGSVILKDVLGSSVKTIENAVIEEVDVSTETLKLTSSPIIPQILAFLDAYQKCGSQGVYSGDVESKWLEIKAEVDEMMRSLWKKYGKS